MCGIARFQRWSPYRERGPHLFPAGTDYAILQQKPFGAHWKRRPRVDQLRLKVADDLIARFLGHMRSVGGNRRRRRRGIALCLYCRLIPGSIADLTRSGLSRSGLTRSGLTESKKTGRKKRREKQNETYSSPTSPSQHTNPRTFRSLYAMGWAAARVAANLRAAQPKRFPDHASCAAGTWS